MVDFLYFTDCGLPKKIYRNTIFFETDYASYCKRVSDALGINFSSEYGAYKLCGCKPFYGIIHEEELRGYDYWGFGDIDLVYGNLSDMLNDENYRKYDFITAHSERVAGHLTVMRNVEKYNKAAFNIPLWREKLESEEFHGLDEEPEYGNIINPCKRYINSAYFHFFKRFFGRNRYRYFDAVQRFTQFLHPKVLFKERYTTPIPRPEAPYYYDLNNGKIIIPKGQWYKMPNGGNIYLHFLCFKKTIYRQTEVYWREGFYKIPVDFDFEHSNGLIRISTESIELLDNGTADLAK